VTSEPKLTRPSGFPKAHHSLTRVGQATAWRLALHVIVVTDRGPNSAARWRSSVPLARPLSPPDPNPLAVLRLIRQVLRELRV